LPGFPDEDPQLSLAGWTKEMTALLADRGRVNRVRDGDLGEFGGFDAASALGRLY
jgi:hypothetical protein